MKMEIEVHKFSERVPEWPDTYFVFVDQNDTLFWNSAWWDGQCWHIAGDTTVLLWGWQILVEDSVLQELGYDTSGDV